MDIPAEIKACIDEKHPYTYAGFMNYCKREHMMWYGIIEAQYAEAVKAYIEGK